MTSSPQSSGTYTSPYSSILPLMASLCLQGIPSTPSTLASPISWFKERRALTHSGRCPVPIGLLLLLQASIRPVCPPASVERQEFAVSQKQSSHISCSPKSSTAPPLERLPVGELCKIRGLGFCEPSVTPLGPTLLLACSTAPFVVRRLSQPVTPLTSKMKKKKKPSGELKNRACGLLPTWQPADPTGHSRGPHRCLTPLCSSSRHAQSFLL